MNKQWESKRSRIEHADDATITFTIALHGKHAWECWWKIVTATTASAMGGATDNPRDWEDAIAPPRQGRARAGIQGNLPWNAATTGHYLRPICRVHWAVHTWERGQPREPLSRTCRCSITVLPPYRPFCQSRSETRRLGAGA